LTDLRMWGLFGLMCVWQMSHFMPVLVMRRKEYMKAGFKMYSHNDPDGSMCAGKGLFYAFTLCAFPLGFSYLGLSTWMFAYDGTAICLFATFGTYFQWWRSPNKKIGANKTKKIWYYVLFALFVLAYYHQKEIEYESKNIVVEHVRYVGTDYCPYCPSKPLMTAKCPSKMHDYNTYSTYVKQCI